jgi:tetratricopeptide (TPR) repeat protein
MLALVPGPDIALPAAASLLGIGPDRTRELVRELVLAHLVTEPVPDRYRMHDLVRLYAAEVAAAEDTAADLRDALRRLLDHHVHTAAAADRVLAPNRDQVIAPLADAGVVPESVGNLAAALAWFAAEEPVLLAAIGYAATHGFNDAAWRLAWSVTTFLDRQGRWEECVAVHRTALAAIGPPADATVRAHFHRGLSRAHIKLAQYGEARIQAEAVLALFADLGDPVGQAHAHHDLGLLDLQEHRYRQALHHTRRAADLMRAAGHSAGLAGAFNAMGWVGAQLGEYDEALANCERSLALFTELRERLGRAAALDSLGFIHHRLGNHTDSISCYREAVDLFHAAGNRYGEASALDKLGDVETDAGQPEAARTARQRAYEIYEALNRVEAAAVRAKLAGR